MVSINWTVEEALAANEAALIENPNRTNSDPTLPLYQCAALHKLETLRKKYDQGDKFSLMLAIRICACNGLIMPSWIVKSYIGAFDKVLNYRSKSWDEVFGSPINKGSQLKALEKRRRLEFAVLNEVKRIRLNTPDQAIDAGLFELAGKKFHIGKTLAEEYYYSAARKMSFKP